MENGMECGYLDVYVVKQGRTSTVGHSITST